MTAPVLLFDFFGTLVRYSNSRTEQGFHGSHALAREYGATAGYEEFLRGWVEASGTFDRRSDADDSEFSMSEACTAFLARLLGRAPGPGETERFVDRYVAEWDTGVTYLEGLSRMLRDLRRTHRLAVVSNTHSPTLVPSHLERMGVADLFETVVLSVDLGWRKPHPAIYQAALDRLGITAADAVFIGDSYVPDYVGPVKYGMRALLIAPPGVVDIPDAHRLDGILDTARRVAG
jgi:putative hydrolase of the HAD superfamily